MTLSAIVLAAGRSRRFKYSTSKPLVKIKGRPVIAYSLSVLAGHPAVKEIIVVVNSANRTAIIKAIKSSGIKKIKSVVLGGRLRQDSVKKGLSNVDSGSSLVLIHDAARPFIDRGLLERLIRQARSSQAVIPAVPAKATIKEISPQGYVRKTFKRSCLWEVQTPQVFGRKLILEAYKKYGGHRVTDDASLVEKMGVSVRVVMGSYSNIKLTTAEDLLLAAALAGKRV